MELGGNFVFLSTNEATVCNTLFKKRRINKQHSSKAAPQVTQVALEGVRNNEQGTLKEMPGCVREVGGLTVTQTVA